ncbi:uncharacterized protein LOC110011677 isoform X2 [Sesamum indicum]|uniref:Uncharacterized protein LOC110011677 isoform X2 n=1 Tax=Sesamum indicum TaxID=4182 RepID=A0A8M8UM53_SESIN|nr:uncharacterized protein LOC110011677 isoform X2 [Sesamum indicum]
MSLIIRQFWEEARKNACLGNLHTARLEAAGKKQFDLEKKNRKSWKGSLFSWLETDKKHKSTKQPTKGSTVPKPRRQHFPGPVQGQGAVGGIMTARAQRAASGPLISLFSSTKRADEYEVPYMCLGQQLNSPQKFHSYGPVYLVK